MLVGGIQIKAQALKFANEMQIEDLGLKFSDGWMRHFKSCDGLHYKKAHGKAKSADFAAAQEWLANSMLLVILTSIISMVGWGLEPCVESHSF